MTCDKCNNPRCICNAKATIERHCNPARGDRLDQIYRDLQHRRLTTVFEDHIRYLLERLRVAETCVEAARIVFIEGPTKSSFDSWLKLRYALAACGAEGVKP